MIFWRAQTELYIENMEWAWAYHAQQGMMKKSDIFPLFRDWWDLNIRSVAFCIIIPIFLKLRLVDYFMQLETCDVNDKVSF